MSWKESAKRLSLIVPTYLATRCLWDLRRLAAENPSARWASLGWRSVEAVFFALGYLGLDRVFRRSFTRRTNLASR
ncbi:MAG TPA: hypothetical protein VFO34_12895 [Candidatus Acidoferrales bacterium]|nr:hypothetical protein [Candidatus Acidoferrales bacterium]